MGCSGASDCGYGRAGTSQHHLVLHIKCSGWDKECCHDVFKCFGFYPVVRVTIQAREPVFKLKQCLGQLLTAFNWRGWEMKPLAILTGVHIVSCFILPKQVLGTVALFLEMRIWTGFPGTECLLWSPGVKTPCFFLRPVPALGRTEWKVYLFLLAVGHGLISLAMLV